MRIRPVHDAAEQKEHQHQLHREPEKGGEMEPERLKPSAQPVVHRQRRGDQRPVHGMIRHGAGKCRVDEKPRHIPQFLDERIRRDAVEVVEVKLVLKVVGVSPQHNQ
jgi:hypothetical protein